MKKKFYAIGSLIAIIGPTMAVISCDDSSSSNAGDGGDAGDGVDGGSGSAKLLKEDANIEEAYVVIPEKSLFMTYKQDADKILYSADGNDTALNTELLEKISNSVLGVSKVAFDTLNLKLKGKATSTNTTEITHFVEVPVANNLTKKSIKSAIEGAWTASSRNAAPSIVAKTENSLSQEFLTSNPNEFDAKITNFIPSGNNINNTQLAAVRHGVFSNFLPSQDTKKVNGQDISIKSTPKTSVFEGASDLPTFSRKLLWANYSILKEDHFSIVMSIAVVLASKKLAGGSIGLSDSDVIKYHEAFVAAANASFSEGIDSSDLDSTTLLTELGKIDADVVAFIQEDDLLVKTDV